MKYLQSESIAMGCINDEKTNSRTEVKRVLVLINDRALFIELSFATTFLFVYIIIECAGKF